MANYEISQFKEYVQKFINMTKIDNGNKIIEEGNDELSKVLSSFGLEESQIGDLLEKSDDSANSARRASSTEQQTPEDVHKEFIDASIKYENLSKEDKKQVRKEVAEKALSNYDKMIDRMNEETPLYENVNISSMIESLNKLKENEISGDEFKVKVAQIAAESAQKQHDYMEKMIDKYDAAFSEYDVTYSSPFKKPSGVLSPNIPDNCMLEVMKTLKAYLEDTTSQNYQEYLDNAKTLFDNVNKIFQDKLNEIKDKGTAIADEYKENLDYSLEQGLLSENPTYIKWTPPLDGRPHEEEPDHLAIKGAPIESTFTEVVNNTTTGITEAKTEAKQATIYDLNGIPVTGKKPGVYIQNGKKFVVK